MSRSWDDLVNDSSDEASPCDEVENGSLVLPNVSDELNAVAETSVSSPEDVCNRLKKNLPSFEKEHFSPKNVIVGYKTYYSFLFRFLYSVRAALEKSYIISVFL